MKAFFFKKIKNFGFSCFEGKLGFKGPVFILEFGCILMTNRLV
jgi:hypothetical protein